MLSALHLWGSLFDFKYKKHMRRLFVLLALFSGVVNLSAESFSVGGVYYESQGEEVSLTSVEDKSCTSFVVAETVTYRNKLYSVTSIGEWAFYQCDKLESIILPSSITAIKNNAFADCTSLSGIDFPINVKVIGSGAFRGCKKLSNIFITQNVESVDGSAFSECNNLSQIVVDELNPYYSSANGNLYSKDKEILLFSPLGNRFNENALEGIKRIGGYAFDGHTEITSIQIPSNVVFIGEFAFSNCTNLKELSFAESEDDIEMDAMLFQGCPINKIYFGRNRKYTYRLYYDNRPFAGSQSLRSICFGGKSSEIVDNEFKNCELLNSVDIESNVNTMGRSAFSGCGNLQTVQLPESLATIEQGAFMSSGLTSIVIPQGVENIGINSFAYCKSLKKVQFNNSCADIAEDAFYDDSNLSEVDLGNGIKSIGLSAFYGCRKLQTIIFPSTLSQLGRKAFNGCSGLEFIISKIETPFDFMEDVFDQGTYVNAKLFVPQGYISLYYVTYNWNKFTNIEEGLPSGIKGISDSRDFQKSDSYNILGQKSQMQTKGIYVVKRNGIYRKYMKK